VVAQLPPVAQRCWRCGVSDTRTGEGLGACQTWRGGWTLTEAARQWWGGGAVAFRQRGGSGEPRGSLAAAMGNGKVRVRPQFGQSASLLE
jgi:hypothetical protein